MLVHRLDRVLARTDPFELAQSLERYVREMPADRIRTLVIDARDRMGDYYRSEFVRLLRDEDAGPRFTARELSSQHFAKIIREEQSPQALQHALARLLKSNLRAIPIFGAAFSQAVLAHVPSDRAVALGEESTNGGARFAIFGGLALALVVAGAAGEHFIMSVRAQTAASPLPVLSAPTSISVATPMPPAVMHHTVAQATTAPTAPPATAAPATAAPSTPVPTATAVPPPVVAPAPTPQHTRPPRSQKTAPPASGVATIAIPTPTPTVEPTDLDTSDMPDAYTDATPLPPQTAPPAEAPHRVILNTPTPKPGPHGWIKKSLNHLDPFKPHKP